nr:hypothetical protein [uncultured bacterium]
MIARFNFRNALQLDSPPSLFLIGDVLEGEISTGMVLRIPLRPSLTLNARIEGIELVTSLNRHDSPVALRVAFESEEEAQLISDLLRPGAALEVFRPADV